jgi:hypothetical protein
MTFKAKILPCKSLVYLCTHKRHWPLNGDGPLAILSRTMRFWKLCVGNSTYKGTIVTNITLVAGKIFLHESPCKNYRYILPGAEDSNACFSLSNFLCYFPVNRMTKMFRSSKEKIMNTITTFFLILCLEEFQKEFLCIVKGRLFFNITKKDLVESGRGVFQGIIQKRSSKNWRNIRRISG